MNLFPSLITSFVIVSVIWIIAIFQPNAALANDDPKVSTTQSKQAPPIKYKKKTLAKAKNNLPHFNFENVQISGVSQNISLNQLPSLWQEFNENKTTQSSLKKNPSKVYVYYRDFSSDYESGKVSIGYDIKELKEPRNNISLPLIHFLPLLSKGKYDDLQLQQAWEKIDYRKNVTAIVEVHYLNADSSVNNSELFVSYN
jgi:predicted transcriptional regulator YdeE